MEDRSEYYREPFKFGAASIYESDFITKINNEHWEHFNNAVQSGQGFKIGDFIDLSVNLTIVQMVDFLDEIKKLKTIEEVYKFIDDKIIEIAKEIKLPNSEI